MTYAQLLARLMTLSEVDLDRPVRVLVTGQALVIRQIDVPADGDAVLDTGIAWSRQRRRRRRCRCIGLAIVRFWCSWRLWCRW
jgi:hypothetical protein